MANSYERRYFRERRSSKSARKEFSRKQRAEYSRQVAAFTEPKRPATNRFQQLLNLQRGHSNAEAAEMARANLRNSDGVATGTRSRRNSTMPQTRTQANKARIAQREKWYRDNWGMDVKSDVGGRLTRLNGTRTARTILAQGNING